MTPGVLERDVSARGHSHETKGEVALFLFIVCLGVCFAFLSGKTCCGGKKRRARASYFPRFSLFSLSLSRPRARSLLSL